MTIDRTQLIEQVISPVIERSIAKALREAQPQKPKFGRYMTVEQLATESGYSKHTLYQKNCAGQIPGAVKMGRGKLMFETGKALQWLEDGCPKLKQS